MKPHGRFKVMPIPAHEKTVRFDLGPSFTSSGELEPETLEVPLQEFGAQDDQGARIAATIRLGVLTNGDREGNALLLLGPIRLHGVDRLMSTLRDTEHRAGLTAQALTMLLSGSALDRKKARRLIREHKLLL